MAIKGKTEAEKYAIVMRVSKVERERILNRRSKAARPRKGLTIAPGP